MFCYFENGKAYLFRGIPEKWRGEAAFRNVRLPGRWTVSADSRTIVLDGPPGELLSVVLDGRERRLPPGKHPAGGTRSLDFRPSAGSMTRCRDEK